MSLNVSFIETPQVTISVAEGPANGPLMVILPGLANTWRVFRPMLPKLLPEWRVLSFDYRGHGQSGRTPGEYWGMKFFSDLHTLAKRLIHEPAILLTHSFGGAMGMQLAIDFPEKVRALVIGDTPFDIPSHVETMNQPQRTRLFSLRRRLAGRPPEELQRRGVPPCYAEELHRLDPDVLQHYAEGCTENFYQNAQNVDYTRVTCPTLIVQANPEKGGLLFDEDMERVRAQRPDFHYARIDTDHELDIAKGADSPFLQVVLEFLGKTVLQDGVSA